jgi:hypothetical protein
VKENAQREEKEKERWKDKEEEELKKQRSALLCLLSACV